MSVSYYTRIALAVPLTDETVLFAHDEGIISCAHEPALTAYCSVCGKKVIRGPVNHRPTALARAMFGESIDYAEYKDEVSDTSPSPDKVQVFNLAPSHDSPRELYLGFFLLNVRGAEYTDRHYIQTLSLNTLSVSHILLAALLIHHSIAGDPALIVAPYVSY